MLRPIGSDHFPNSWVIRPSTLQLPPGPAQSNCILQDREIVHLHYRSHPYAQNYHNGRFFPLQASPPRLLRPDPIRLTDCCLFSAFFRRNFQMLGVVFASAFAFEMAYDTGMNKLWDNLNKGCHRPPAQLLLPRPAIALKDADTSKPPQIVFPPSRTRAAQLLDQYSRAKKLNPHIQLSVKQKTAAIDKVLEDARKVLDEKKRVRDEALANAAATSSSES
ncbi:hypothetical protein NUW58_g3213 [Xylaria curta]|uniref:Uncharacterized protein n=1 Tax=Xylaria curta TaxID=42375 RepID=A0ACC1PCY8_9PEZI|nr:hypothetical protein NUW58_g3213 [Xylaria curta]